MTSTANSLNLQEIGCHIGKKIRERRLQLNLKQHTVAKELGVTMQQVHKYEKGIDRVSASRLLQLSYFLRVPLSYFYEGLMKEEQFLPESDLLPSYPELLNKKVSLTFTEVQGVLTSIRVIGEHTPHGSNNNDQQE